jgi:hypothetical protein
VPAIGEDLLAHVGRTVAQVLRHRGAEDPLAADRQDRQAEGLGQLPGVVFDLAAHAAIPREG